MENTYTTMVRCNNCLSSGKRSFNKGVAVTHELNECENCGVKGQLFPNFSDLSTATITIDGTSGTGATAS